MGALHPLRVPETTDADGILASLKRLVQLELELGLAETRELFTAAVTAATLAVSAAVALIASLVLLLAAALAPLFDARWEHLVIAAGGVFLLAAATLGWNVQRLRSLGWPRRTPASLVENLRWLEAQLRSRLRLR